MHKIKFIIMLTIILLPSLVMAHDYGRAGATFPIIEPDLLFVLKSRVIQLQRTGYFKKLEFSFRDQVKNEINRPNPVTGITTTVTQKAWDYDPSIIMPQNIYSPSGKLIVKAGEKYNPLQNVNLGEVLLFYNADDPEQVKWAKHEDKTLKGKDKLILVNGSVLKQRKLFKKPIYFDQLGRLTTRFHIQHVPAAVKQVGLRLQVREVLP